MRALLISAALIAACVATPATAQSECAVAPPLAVDVATDAGPPLVAIATEDAVPLARLSPLAQDSPWRARFEAAADELLPALQSREQRRWQPLLGGRWLGEADRHAVQAILDDRCSAFASLLDADRPIDRAILGWSVAASYSDDEISAMAARPEAEALVCWSARNGRRIMWPTTAREADNRAGRPYACARISYSIRDNMPKWRAFIETPESRIPGSGA